MRRICVLIGSLGVGGAEKQSALLAKALADSHETHYVAMRDRPCHQRHRNTLAQAKIDPIFLRGSPGQKLRWFASFLKSKRIELLFAHLPGDILMAAAAGTLGGVPVICGGIRNARIAVHKRAVLRVLHNRVLRCSISNSHAGRAALVARGFAPQKLVVIPNGIEICKPGGRSAPGQEVRVASVGRLVKQKDYRTALKSIARVKRRLGPRRRIRYVIAGLGPLEQRCRAWIRDLALEEDVELRVDPREVESIYRDADVYLCTSLFEGLSNTLLEAMASGLPVVATDAGDNRLLVQEGVNGHLVPVGDDEAIAERLLGLIEDGERRAACGQRSLELVSGYSFDRFQSRYLELVESLT